MLESKTTKKGQQQGFFAGNLTANLKYLIALMLLVIGAALVLVLTLQDSIGGEQTLTDSVTKAEIEAFADYQAPQEVFHFKYDAMDRGNHDYSLYPLLVDPNSFHENIVTRGEVIVYDYEFFDGIHKTISRVVGLPGEAVEIIDGQIYIDDQKLAAFYGSAHHLGFGSNEEYNEALKASGSLQNIDSMKELFSKDTENFELGADELFVVGDDWFRGGQHVLNSSEVQGKVLGYFKE